MIFNFVKALAAVDPASPCTGGNFLAFPTWFEYLPKKIDETDPAKTLCTPQITGITDVWLVVAAIIDILLRVAAIMAVAYVIYGGVLYMLSQGESDKTAQARHTIINAVIGLVIALVSAAAVTFVANRFGK